MEALKEATANLFTGNFSEYLIILKNTREFLEKNKSDASFFSGIDEEDFKGIIRPYYWYVHEPGFQDVYETFENGMIALSKNTSLFLESDEAGLKTAFLNVLEYCTNYLEDGLVKPGSWIGLGLYSVETEMQTALSRFEKLFLERKVSTDEIRRISDLRGLIADIELSKHEAYFSLRVIGYHCLPWIRMYIAGLNGTDQAFILHALDEFKGNQDIINFYNHYISINESTFLKETALKYLKRTEDN